MPPKRSRLIAALVNIAAALGGVLGVSALIRRLAGSEPSAPSESTPPQQATQGRHMETRAVVSAEPRTPTTAPLTVGHSIEMGEVERGAARTYDVPDHPPAITQVQIRPGWQRVEHIHLPEPTYWPAVMALGIVFIAWGIVTSWLITGVGLILLGVALAGWIGDIQHERH